MKHIKTYTKLFESESEDSEIQEVIKELFLELQDEGFDVTVEPNYSSASRDKVFSYNVMIKKQWGEDVEHLLTEYERGNYGPQFVLRDVLDSIVMCSGYLKEHGYQIWDVDGLVLNKSGNYVAKDMAYIANLDPRINLQRLPMAICKNTFLNILHSILTSLECLISFHKRVFTQSYLVQKTEMRLENYSRLEISKHLQQIMFLTRKVSDALLNVRCVLLSIVRPIYGFFLFYL